MNIIIDRTKKYFFHNIYGNEQYLLDRLPDDVVAIPVGWDEVAEQNRNNYLAALYADTNIHCSYTTIPDILYFRNEFEVDALDSNDNLIKKTIEAQWWSLRIEDVKAETWDSINEKIEKIKR